MKFKLVISKKDHLEANAEKTEYISVSFDNSAAQNPKESKYILWKCGKCL
jgi:hypothetical protein